MKKKSGGAIWGLLLIALGLSIAARTFGFHFSIFFRGWWTLFIIIPSFIGLCNEGKKKRTSNIIGLCIGIFLLLSSWGMMPTGLLFPLLIAGIFVIIGTRMIFGDKESKGNSKRIKEHWAEDKKTRYYQEDIWVDYESQDSFYSTEYYDQNHDQNHRQESEAAYDKQDTYHDYAENHNHSKGSTADYRDYRKESFGANEEPVACSAIFNGKNLRYDYEPFTGGVFSVMFGGIDLDLRHAVICNDVTIDAKVILGGMDIILPDHVRVVLNDTAILGGIDNRRKNPSIVEGYMPTVFINATCILGGVDIK